MRRKATWRLCLAVTTALKPRLWIVIRGVIATIATTPKASSITSEAPCIVMHAPITIGNMKLEVRGPLATPPESKAMAVYSPG